MINRVNENKQFFNINILIVGGIAFDQIIKLSIVNNMDLYDSISIIPNIFYITYIVNTGAAFSMLKGNFLALIVIPVIVIILLYGYMFVKRKEMLFIEQTAMAMIISGGIGNLIDRIATGKVIDFLDFRIWPVFNIADILVSLGCVTLIVAVLFSKEKS